VISELEQSNDEPSNTRHIITPNFAIIHDRSSENGLVYSIEQSSTRTWEAAMGIGHPAGTAMSAPSAVVSSTFHSCGGELQHDGFTG